MGEPSALRREAEKLLAEAEREEVQRQAACAHPLKSLAI